MNSSTRLLIAASAAAVLAIPVFADSDGAGVKELRSRIEALEQRILALEARVSFASFMPNLAERFHVMHRAGEAGDWAVASHELAEVKRLTALSTAVDADQGRLMQAMMAPNLEELGEAVEHGDQAAFAQALKSTVATCNACHAATGSAFIDVTLDARDSLSLRHPHRLLMRGVPQAHHHDEPAGASAGMPGHAVTDESMPHGHAVGTPAHAD